MQVSIPFSVGDYVEDLVTHETIQVIGVQYKHGKFGNGGENWYHCVSINTTGGQKCWKELKLAEIDYNSNLMDYNGV